MEFEPTTETLFQESQKLKGGLGAIAWATLEMFKRGGLPQKDIDQLTENMSTYFANPTSDECNEILKVVEERLDLDQVQEGVWYEPQHTVEHPAP